jgi:hypothetical protein
LVACRTSLSKPRHTVGKRRVCNIRKVGGLRQKPWLHPRKTTRSNYALSSRDGDGLANQACSKSKRGATNAIRQAFCRRGE